MIHIYIFSILVDFKNFEMILNNLVANVPNTPLYNM